MASSWKYWNGSAYIFPYMHAAFNTGGGYRNLLYPSVSCAHNVSTIRGYVCPVIYDVFFRQHRRVLSFLRVFDKGIMRYISAGDGWRGL